MALDAPAGALGQLVLGERAAGQPSLSARTAKSGQMVLMAGSRSSLSAKVRRPASMGSAGFMRPLP